ncbi:MAG: flagellar export chaperone FliS [Candidatus Obscuribacterales bacterium]|nr:flagellar export chaperone FliS [Steroidobacteraceae bacterium]
MAHSGTPRLSAYRNTAAHGGVAAADPHGLILLLMSGALERIAKARGCIVNKAYTDKAHLIHRAVAIIDELSGCLDLQSGGELAKNLHELYDYMCRQLLRATVENNIDVLDEVTRLLNQIRDAWAQLPKDIGRSNPR